MNFRKFSLLTCLFLFFFSTIFSQEDITRQWPQFRGYLGSGILEQTGLPESWDLKTGENILWKTPIPGLAHSCPVVWGNRIFVTTAVGASELDSLKIGLYGDIDMASDTLSHQFKVYCIDRLTGKIIWDRIADQGIPKERRHTKSTYANPTPATDGKHLVVSFGSQGLFCYDFDGNLLWKKDLGNLATGPFNETGVEWGYSSSPVIHDGRIIVQCDLLKNSFLTTLDVNTGKEIWRIGNVGDAPAPTPVIANNLVYVNSAHGKFSPILAIRTDATGNITPPAEADKNMPPAPSFGNPVAWSFPRGGAYMASPLVYGNYLYNLQISGLLTCINAYTGAVKYKKELGKAFSASGVASGNKLYFTAETGEILVIQAGEEYKLLAENKMDDVCMASPAISDKMLIFRTQHFLIAIGKK